MVTIGVFGNNSVNYMRKLELTEPAQVALQQIYQISFQRSTSLHSKYLIAGCHENIQFGR